MKLAEALSHRTALADKIRETESRLVENVKVQEGDSPVEDPTAVIMDLESTLADLHALIYRINLTNTRTIVGGRSLTDLLAERDMAKQRARVLSAALKHLTERGDRFSRNEIKYVPTIDSAELRRRYEEAVSRLRKLDLLIQSAGWTTELLTED